jgi:hypothetical protein
MTSYIFNWNLIVYAHIFQGYLEKVFIKKMLIKYVSLV